MRHPLRSPSDTNTLSVARDNPRDDWLRDRSRSERVEGQQHFIYYLWTAMIKEMWNLAQSGNLIWLTREWTEVERQSEESRKNVGVAPIYLQQVVW